MYTPPVPGYAPQGGQTDTLAIVSLVCGIASLPTGFCCTFFGIPLSLAAIVTGAIAIGNVGKQPHLKGKELAIGGIVTGSIGIVLFIVGLVIGLSGAFLNRL
jgi:hypothetical protein